MQFYRPVSYTHLDVYKRQGLASLASVALNVGAAPYGDAAVAAMGVVGRISMFIVSAVLGFGQGFQPVVGYNYGARQYGRVRQAFFFTVKVGTLVLAALAIVGYLFAPSIIALFRRDDPQVIAIGAYAFRAQCLALPLQALIIIANMLLQVTGHAASATLTSSARQGLFFLPLIVILPAFMGLTGVQIAQPLADVAAFICCIPLLARFFRRLPEDVLLAQGDMPAIPDVYKRPGIGPWYLQGSGWAAGVSWAAAVVNAVDEWEKYGAERNNACLLYTSRCV